MGSEKPDWEVIRKEYESGGLSLQRLAAKHGVSKTYLIEKRDKGNWDRPTDRPTANRTSEDGSIRILRSELPSIPSAVDGARIGIEALVHYLKDHKKEMDLVDHVKAATALYQYNRIIVNAVELDDDDDIDLITIDTRDLDTDQLDKLKAFATEMKDGGQVG